METLTHETLAHNENRVSRGTWLERLLCAVAAIALALLCVIITISVVTRVFGVGLIPDDVLLVEELMVIVVLFPLAAITANGEHINVTIFTERVGDRSKQALALLGDAVGIVFGFALAVAGAESLLDALASGEYSEGKLYLPVWAGWAAFSIATSAFLLRLFLQIRIDLYRRRHAG